MHTQKNKISVLSLKTQLKLISDRLSFIESAVESSIPEYFNFEEVCRKCKLPKKAMKKEIQNGFMKGFTPDGKLSSDTPKYNSLRFFKSDITKYLEYKKLTESKFSKK